MRLWFCFFFFVIAMVAVTVILRKDFWYARLDALTSRNDRGGFIHLTNIERNLERDEEGGFVSNDVYKTNKENVSSEYVVSFDENSRTRQRSLAEYDGPEEESPISFSNFTSRGKNYSDYEKFLENTPWYSKTKKFKRDVDSDFEVQDFESLYGNNADLPRGEVIYLMRRVVEDLQKCDLMSLLSNFVSIPGYDGGKKPKKFRKFFRSKRNIYNDENYSEPRAIDTQTDDVSPELMEEAEIRKEAEEMLKRSKRSFEKIFNFFKPEKALRLVPELIRGEGYPSEIHKVVTEDGYVLELHRIPGPRNVKKTRKKKFRKRDVRTDEEKPDPFLETLEETNSVQRSPNLSSSSSRSGNAQSTNSTSSHADQLLRWLEENIDNTNILFRSNDFKLSRESDEKSEGKSYLHKINTFADWTNKGFSPGEEPVHSRTKRSPRFINFYPIFVPENYDSSPEYVTSNLKRKKIPSSKDLSEVFDVFHEKWVPRSKHRRPSVLIHHGLFASSANFVLSDGDGGALAYMLANAGYDVWLGNWRGNTYSTGHTTLDPNSREYWNFSLDEIIKYDIPAAVNYILAVGGQHSLRYVGHSLGCAMLFGATNEDPSLAWKVKMMIAMAPAAFMDNSYGALKNTILSVKNFYYLLDRLRLPDLLSPAPVQVQLANHFCGPSSFWRVPCLLLVDAFMGKVKEPMKEYYTNVLLSHFPSTLASTRILAHFGQFVNSYGMRKYNYGPNENYERYGQVNPPKYTLQTVTFPVVIFWGPGDSVVTPEDVLQSIVKLPNLIIAIPVFDVNFNHLDFIFPEQARGLVYRPMLQVLEFSR